MIARGLSPAPADRWPDMRTLLRELEAAVAQPGRRHPSRIPVIIATALATAATVVAVSRWPSKPTSGAASGCAPASEALGSAWSGDPGRPVATGPEIPGVRFWRCAGDASDCPT